jgi:hypothetical protein
MATFLSQRYTLIAAEEFRDRYTARYIDLMHIALAKATNAPRLLVRDNAPNLYRFHWDLV